MTLSKEQTRSQVSAKTSGETEPSVIRLAAVVSHPIQHYVPLFRRLAEHPQFEVKVFYCCDWGVREYHDPGFNCKFSWDVSLLGGYDHEFLPSRRHPRNMGFWEVDNPSVGARLQAFAPHLLYLHGYGHRTCWRAAKWAKGRAALLHFGDSQLINPRSWWRRLLKQVIVRWHFRRCDAFLTVGDNNEQYYRHYGVPAEKLFRGAIAIDLKRFQEALAAPGRPSREAVRRRYGLPEKGLVALHVGKLQTIKRPDHFVQAIARLNSRGTPVWGLLVGDGPLRPALEKQIVELGVSERVRITGFVNQAAIPLVLEAGDFLVMTSERDAHPLVITEGMVVGLPAVVSDRVGCVGSTDSARPDVNALVYPFGKIEELAERIRRIVEDEGLRQRMSQASHDLLPTQDAEVSVQAVCRAVEYLRPTWGARWAETSSKLKSQRADSQEGTSLCY